MRAVLFFLAFVFCLDGSWVLAAEETSAPIHNEYHNSQIYYGREAPEKSDDDYGIRTYRDQETGDIVTSVRSRRRQETNQNYPQSMPVIIEPRIPYY